jgi:DNA-directed RNA polymerase subunit N (RpoN/RPB10)
MTITQDEGWREIRQELTKLLYAYGVREEDAEDIMDDLGADLECCVREAT